jgi:hypothetical protein
VYAPCVLGLRPSALFNDMLTLSKKKEAWMEENMDIAHGVIHLNIMFVRHEIEKWKRLCDFSSYCIPNRLGVVVWVKSVGFH